jgi:hypothetical protein
MNIGLNIMLHQVDTLLCILISCRQIGPANFWCVNDIITSLYRVLKFGVVYGTLVKINFAQCKRAWHQSKICIYLSIWCKYLTKYYKYGRKYL